MFNVQKIINKDEQVLDDVEIRSVLSKRYFVMRRGKFPAIIREALIWKFSDDQHLRLELDPNVKGYHQIIKNPVFSKFYEFTRLTMDETNWSVRAGIITVTKGSVTSTYTMYRTDKGLYRIIIDKKSYLESM